MSQITDKIREFHDNGGDWATLRDWLANRAYQRPHRMIHQKPIDEQSDDDFGVTEEGTWDEVTHARNVGWLTGPQFLEVSKAHDKYVNNVRG